MVRLLHGENANGGGALTKNALPSSGGTSKTFASKTDIYEQIVVFYGPF